MVRTVTSADSGEMMLYLTTTGTATEGATMPFSAPWPRSTISESQGNRSTFTVIGDWAGVC